MSHPATHLCFSLLVFLLAGPIVCYSQTPIRRHTPSGYLYTVIRSGKGKHPIPGQYVVANLRVFTKDSVWHDTRNTPLGKAVLKIEPKTDDHDPLVEMLPQLVAGDSAVLRAPAKLIFTKVFHQPLPTNLNPETVFNFTIGVVSVINQEQFDKLANDFKNAFEERTKAAAAAQLEKDIALIDAYLKKNQMEAIVSESGVRYVIKSPGVGHPAAIGEKVKFNHTGWFLDGAYFDSSIASVARAHGFFKASTRYEPMSTTLGNHEVIAGLEEVLLLMNPKATYLIYLPSVLAYGPTGVQGQIPPNAVLVYEVERL